MNMYQWLTLGIVVLWGMAMIGMVIHSYFWNERI